MSETSPNAPRPSVFRAEIDATSDFTDVCAVVMAGGSGTRLWPESRRNRPKPFLPLLPDGRSTLAATFDRLAGLVPPERRFVVAGRSFASLVADALPTLDARRALLEPCGRDTAPCVAWAALEALQVSPNATLIVLPSDHQVSPDRAFRAALAQAVRLVEADETRLVALGVVPTEPSSAYGYVEIGATLSPVENRSNAASNADAPGVFEAFSVASFREKPDGETARRFLESGRYFWNAGVFVWKARRILELIRRFEPELGATFDRIARIVADAAANARTTADDPAFVREFSGAKRVSIDYAVLERAPNVAVVRAPFAWDDLGSFAALERTTTSTQTSAEQAFNEESGNVAVGADLAVENARGSFVRVLSPPVDASKRRKLVALVDVDDLLVVETDDALLVAKKGSDDAIRRLVERLKAGRFDAYL